MQTYIATEHSGKKYLFHVCEECGSRPETEAEIIKKYFAGGSKGKS